MNARIPIKYSLAVAIAVVAIMSSVLIEPHASGFLSRSAFANNYQVTTVFVNSEDLSEPYLLKIKASSSLSYLSGSVSCNGQIIQHLENRMMNVNLSPYLRQGQNEIAITGQYSPANAEIEIELIGPDSQVTQSTSGSGKLNQGISIEVQ